MKIIENTTRWLGLVLACGIVTYAASAQTVEHETQKLLASDGVAQDLFGWSISISGDRAIVGSSHADAAYMFERVSGVWTEVAKLTASHGIPGVAFGTTVSVSGDTAVVGARDPYDNTVYGGAAHVYERIGGVWTEVAKLTARDEASGNSGPSVSVSGDRIIVGAQYDEENGYDSGAAYVYERIGRVWTKVAKLTASGGSHRFGNSVSVSGDYALVGTDLGPASYVYERIGGVWTEVATLTAGAVTSGIIGQHVSVSGGRAIVGASGDDGNGDNSGAAYVYERLDGVWTEVARLTASDAAAGDVFGWSVTLSGDHAIVGAYGDSASGTYSGSAYLFERIRGVWTEVVRLTASDAAASDAFGFSVSVSGDHAIVGALGDDDSGFSSGSAYVYGLHTILFNDIEFLIAHVVLLNLQQGIANSLVAMLGPAVNALGDINYHDDVAAKGSLQAFITAVSAQQGKFISQADGDALIAEAQAIIDRLNVE